MSHKTDDLIFLQKAIDLARQGMMSGEGGPFGCVIVKGGKIIGEGNNRVTSTNDPTAHAEVIAIREACTHLDSFRLSGCTVYASCEPCPMCLGAIYWARPDRVVFANTKQQAAEIGFDDAFIYKELPLDTAVRSIPFLHVGVKDAELVFMEWQLKLDKEIY